MNRITILMVLLMTPFLGFGQTMEELVNQYFSGRFLYAGVQEGTFSFGFQDTNGNWMYFLHEANQGDTIPLTLYLEEAEHFANPVYYGRTFRVGYASFFEERGESGEPYWFHKIQSLDVLPDETDLADGPGKNGHR